jgi:hypothetical protein
MRHGTGIIVLYSMITGMMAVCAVTLFLSGHALVGAFAAVTGAASGLSAVGAIRRVSED